jgi:glycosyltransferase involved in cell wall biosynthesis
VFHDPRRPNSDERRLKAGKLTINLVAWDNAGGLRTDVQVLSEVLASFGCAVRFNGRIVTHPRGFTGRFVNAVGKRLRHVCAVISRRAAYDVNIFLESVDERFIPHARLNCVIPNPEWFRETDLPHLSRLDWVLCKTRHAIDAFRALQAKTRYIGFSSFNRWDGRSECSPTPLRFLHAAGASRWKGTAAVVKAWCRHPEWPLLVVIRRETFYGGPAVEQYPAAANIQYVTEYLDDQTFRGYQNSCAVHVCPSEAEGFGHHIVEAMSCGAVVITTDGPPMNELVTSERGVLVRPERSERMRLATAFFVDTEHLEHQIGNVIAMSPEARCVLGANARRWYEANSSSFRAAMGTFLDEVRSGV